MVKRNSILPWVWPLTYLGPFFAASGLWAWVTLGVPSVTVPTVVRLAGAVLFAVAVTSGVLRISPRISEHVEWFEGSLVERVTSFLFYLTICFVFALLVTGTAVLVIAPSQTARLYAVAVGLGLVGLVGVEADRSVGHMIDPSPLFFIFVVLSISIAAVIFIFDGNPLFENIVGGVAVALLCILILLVMWILLEALSNVFDVNITIPWGKMATVLFGIAGLLVVWATVELGLKNGLRAAGTAGATFGMAFGGATGLYIFHDNDALRGRLLTVEWVLRSVSGSVGVLSLGVGIPSVLLSVDASIAFIYAVGVLVAAVGFFFFIIENNLISILYVLCLAFTGGLIMGLITLDWITPEVTPVVLFAVIVLTGFSTALGLLVTLYIFEIGTLIALPVFVLVCGVGLLLTAPAYVVLTYLLAVVLTGVSLVQIIGESLPMPP